MKGHPEHDPGTNGNPGCQANQGQTSLRQTDYELICKAALSKQVKTAAAPMHP